MEHPLVVPLTFDGLLQNAFAPDAAIAVLTSAMPAKGTPNEASLRAMVPSPIRYVVDLSAR